MERYETYYRSLYQAVRTINSSLQPSQVLATLVEQAAKAMNAKGSTLRLLDKSGRYLRAGASHGLSRAYLRKGQVEVDKSGVDKEALSGKTVTIADVCCDPRFQYPEAARDEHIVSLLVTPLTVEGRAIGVLRVYSETPREFDAAEIEFLEAIANLSAIAIENARLHAALKSDYEKLAAFEYRIFED